MSVVINEVDHVAPQGEAPSRADSRGGGGQGPSPAAAEAAMIDALRRETSRLARLWAD